MRLTRTSLVVALATASISLGLAPTGLRAGEKKTAKKPDAAAAAASEPDAHVTLGGLRVAVDPKTGELRPMTPAEAKKLQDEMRRMFPERVVDAPTVRPDGSLSAVVAPNTLRFSVVRVGADGRLDTECTEGSKEALGFLTDTKSPKPAEK